MSGVIAPNGFRQEFCPVRAKRIRDKRFPLLRGGGGTAFCEKLVKRKVSRTKSGKKKSRAPRPNGPVSSRSLDPKAPLDVKILPAGGVSRTGLASPKVDTLEPEDKNFYGETGSQMMGRVRRELRNIAVLAVVSFGVGLLAVQLVKS